MIVLSLALVIAAAVALFIGLFVTTGLAFIYIAIGLCLVSLLLLWFGTRSRRAEAPAAPSPPVYGGVRSGSTAAPVRRTTVSGDDTGTDEVDDVAALDELTAPEGGGVVRTTSARDRAAARVSRTAAEPSGEADESTPAATPSDDVTDDVAASSQEGPGDGGRLDHSNQAPATPMTSGTKKASTKKAATRKASTRKKAATKKAATKKAATTKTSTSKKASTKKAATKKAATTKASTSKKAATKKAATTRGTGGAAARARLAQVPGVGPAKADALLSHYGSLEAIRDASVDDMVANIRGVGQALATRIKDALR